MSAERTAEQDAAYDLGDIQELIDSGLAWRLEGHVGRQCMEAIERGLAVLGPERQKDYWGNTIPGRHDVVEGTKGSVTFALAQIEELQETWSINEEDEVFIAERRADVLALECPDCRNRYDDAENGCDTCAAVKDLL